MGAVLFALCALFLALPARAQQAPEVIRHATAESFAACRDAGGRPELTPDYQIEADLNGDGQPDYIIDLAGLNCVGAASFFCGSAGCPVSAYLSTPDGYRPVHFGHAQGWSIDRSGPRPAIVFSLHGSSCGRAGYQTCQRRWTADQATAAPSPPRRVTTPAPRAAAPSPRTPPSATGQWSLHAVPGGSPVARVAGPGVIRDIALFCHQNAATAAFVLRARPPRGAVILSWIVGRDRVNLPLSQRPDGGEAWYADLSRTTLPWLLVNRRGTATIRINGGIQGPLRLAGAAPMVRGALEPCHRL